MRVLFVGNAKSYLLINLAVKLKECVPAIEIDILSEFESTTNEASAAFRNIYDLNNHSGWSKKKYIKVLWYAWYIRKLVNQLKDDYDVIHIFYLSSVYRLIWRQLKSKGKEIVITVFGSEFYASNILVKLFQRKMVSDAKFITATNENTLKGFSSFFNIPERRQVLCRFGLSVLDEIENVTNEEILQFKKNYRVSENSLVIACGYNTSSNQNLEVIIDQVNSVKNTLGDIVLFFQFRKADCGSYTDSIIDLVKQKGIPFVVLTQFFTEKELAIYRKSVDVFIQVQNTDQLSGAMQEFLAAGCNVITGSWLPYSVLDEMNIDYLKVDHLNDIGEVLKNSLKRNINKSHNQKMINNLSGWDGNIDKWLGLYMKS